jgi:hypothetical protein
MVETRPLTSFRIGPEESKLDFFKTKEVLEKRHPWRCAVPSIF